MSRFNKFNKNVPLLFFGTPDFAVAPLAALCENGYNVAGVVTQPDKPKGRGYNLSPPPVKVYAGKRGIEVYQPVSLKKRAFARLLEKINPSIIIVAAYGKLLPSAVINRPEFGCINVHASLLPRHRGAAPIQRAILEGDRVTGVTIMQMDEGLDTGDMLYKTEMPIEESDNFGTLHDKLASAGAEALITALGLLENGGLTPEKQCEDKATYAAKIEEADCILDFSQSALSVHNRVRALSPFPLASARLRGKKVKFIETAVYDHGNISTKPGEVISVSGGTIKIACGGGTLEIKALLPEGKRRMTASDFINGRGAAVGDVFLRYGAEQ